jgi:hypothetical protein
MSGSDLIVAAPWIAFGIGLLVLCIQLFRSRRASTQQPTHRRHDERKRTRQP